MSYLQKAALAVTLAVSLMVSGCGLGGPAAGTCLSEDSQAVIIDLVREEVEKRAARDLRDGDRQIASMANLRASLALIQLAIEDVRTSKEDPDSSRKFCAGSFKAVFPAAMIADAEKSYELIGAGTIETLADQYGVERSADTFTYDLDFSVQPTDDGKKIYGEIEQPDSLVNFLAEMVVAHLASGEIQRVKTAEAQAAAEQDRLNLEAQTAQRQAVLSEARTEYDLSRQTLTAMWDAMPKDAQDQLTANQTAWNQRKRADCNLEAAQYSTEPTEREAARMRCDARMTRERVSALRSWAGY